MTEDEAKTKWCPFARRAVLVRDTVTKEPTGIVSSGNRFGGEHSDPGSDPLCIGSACMAWRWVEPKTEGYQPNDGRCGLAGQWPPPALPQTTDGAIGTRR